MGREMISVFFLSNDEQALSKAFKEFEPQLQNTEAFAVTSFDCELKGLKCVNEKAFLELLPDEAFQGRYGGNRNKALLIAALQGSHAVFFDDDTRPANDCVVRYASLFREGKQIICGKYIHHAAGTAGLLLEAISALTKFKKQKIDASECSVELKKVFCGIPRERSGIVLGAGLNGGNMGVDVDTVCKQAFFPTAYRAEDGIYAALTPFYGTSVYNPKDREEAVARLPIVFHEKKLGEINILREHLVNETKGTNIGFAIQTILQKKPVNKDFVLNAVFKNSLIPYFQEKSAQHGFEDLATQLDEEVQMELAALLSIKKEDVSLPEEEFKKETELFFRVQENWKKTVEEAKKRDLLKKLC